MNPVDPFHFNLARQRVLIVCRANVCRSPLAAMELVGLLDPSVFGPVEVVSAGTRAAEGHTMCVVAHSTGAADDGNRFGLDHRSRPLDAEMIREADLILTMTRDQRGFVARLAPGTQAKTFTLREAATLAELAASAPGEARPSSIESLAAAMAANRWRATTGPDDAKRDELSIADGHLESRRAHRNTAREVLETCRRFVTAASRLASREFAA